MPAVEQLAEVVLERLGALPGLTVLDGGVPVTPPGAYVVFYGAAPALTATRLAGTASSLRWTFQLVCAGRDAAEVRHVVELVLASLTNWRPAGRETSWLSPQPDGAPILRDDSVPGDIRYSQTLTFRLTTTRS